MNESVTQVVNCFPVVAVIGAGTMGIGIAEVAAAHGHRVLLHDVNAEAATQALEQMAARLRKRVERGRISAEEKQAIIERIKFVDDMDALAEASLVIEAIVESLTIKQGLFQKLEQLCPATTLFASNTSSLSITAIAAALNDPSRLIGLHFFNPAPVMKLVEVIAGLQSAEEHLQAAEALCRQWQKIPVRAKSTPGFIVNRVARPFYGEPLKMLQEQLAEPAVIDAVMRESAAFRMGPFQLMDLIGIDVNFAVSRSVFEAFFNDPRYRPSLIQQEMVAAGLLGRKSGRGFYDYASTSAPAASVPYAPPCEQQGTVTIRGNMGMGEPLRGLIRSRRCISLMESNGSGYLLAGGCAVVLANGQTATQRAREHGYKCLVHVDLAFDFATAKTITLAFSERCEKHNRDSVIGLFQAVGKQVLVVPDEPGLIAMRTVVMLVNEAAEAVLHGVCSEQDVDQAMRHGVNYPEGPLAWGEKIGFRHVLNTLQGLQDWFGDDRYRPSAWLRHRVERDTRQQTTA